MLNAHYKYHKLNNALNQFKNGFCIDNALVKIENNQLILLI